MSDISADRRLELIRTVREEQARNHMTIKRRESLLYGNDYRNDYTYTTTGQGGLPASHVGVKLRILAALILFLTFLILDKNGISVLQFNTDMLFEQITSNTDTFDFIQEAADKLKD